MTSNTGSHLIQKEFQNISEVNHDEIIETTRDKVFELLKETIKPEFLNRIDEVIMFTPLFRDDIREIVNLQFKHIQERLLKNRIDIRITDEALDWLADKGFDQVYGARPLKRLLQKSILNELSKGILSEKVSSNDKILIDLHDGEISFVNE